MKFLAGFLIGFSIATIGVAGLVKTLDAGVYKFQEFILEKVK